MEKYWASARTSTRVNHLVDLNTKQLMNLKIIVVINTERQCTTSVGQPNLCMGAIFHLQNDIIEVEV